MKLALGTVQFGINYGVNNTAGKLPEEEVALILNTAYDYGISILDTAISYGESQKMLGRIGCNKFKIVSKFPSVKSIEELDEAIYRSFEELNVSSIYCFMAHDFFSIKDRLEIWTRLDQYKKEGLIDKIGLSVYFPDQINWIFDNNVKFDVVQFPYNVFDQRFLELLPEIKAAGIETHARSIFLQGLFFMNPKIIPSHFQPVVNKIYKIRKLSDHYSIPLNQLLLAFGLFNDNIDKVVIGVDSLSNLKENILATEQLHHSKLFMDDLHELKEDDENVLLPFNWNI